ncbi:hypothetical protein AGMMS50268_25120 [Spirochaetia bacterium]|nr:hypothetical protein AGMMS50268_25120 [Spirochaetia bacterium]
MPGKSQPSAEAVASSEELPGVAQQQPPAAPAGTPPEGDGNAKDKNAKPGKRLNLTRFLQEKPQSSGVRVLLNAKYRTAVKTLEEWETALTDLLGKKTK